MFNMNMLMNEYRQSSQVVGRFIVRPINKEQIYPHVVKCCSIVSTSVSQYGVGIGMNMRKETKEGRGNGKGAAASCQ